MAKFDIPSLDTEQGFTLSTKEITKYLENNPEKLKALQQDPITELPKVIKETAQPKPAYFHDKWMYRWVAISLGLVVFTSAVGAIILSGIDKTTPDLLVAVGSGAVGALAGLFAPKG